MRMVYEFLPFDCWKFQWYRLNYAFWHDISGECGDCHFYYFIVVNLFWTYDVFTISVLHEIPTTRTIRLNPWWRHQMETFSASLAICEGNQPVDGEFPTQRPVARSFDVFFDLCPNKRLSKKSWGWWLETPSSSLWCHRKARAKYCPACN